MTQTDLDTLARLLEDAKNPCFNAGIHNDIEKEVRLLLRNHATDFLALARVGLAQHDLLARLKAAEAECDELRGRIANALL